jgi:hypothetical protein
MAQKNTPFPLAGIFDIGVITTIVIGLLYTAGWSYAYHYFDRFHLGLIGLEIKQDTLFIYSLWVLKDSLAATLACLCTIGFYYILRWFWQQTGNQDQTGSSQDQDDNSQQKTSRPKWLWFITLVAAPIYLLGLFMFFYQLGAWVGWSSFDREAENDFPSYPRVKVWMSVEKDNDARLRSEEWAGGCYRLLLRNKDNLYVFPADGMSDKIPTEIIPNKKVEAIRVLPLYQSSVECQ